MITGAHCILYSSDPEADRLFLRDVLHLSHVDAGDGWLIFALPPAEVAMHPCDEGGEHHELYLMCDDVEATIAALNPKGVTALPVVDRGWGLVTRLTLPGGDKVGLYQPKHPTALGLAR